MPHPKRFGELLIEGLEEAVAYGRGEVAGAAVRRVPRTVRRTGVVPPPCCTEEGIARVRSPVARKRSKRSSE
jgi:hypothetical protein